MGAIAGGTGDIDVEERILPNLRECDGQNTRIVEP